jgi:hypothetical protein
MKLSEVSEIVGQDFRKFVRLENMGEDEDHERSKKGRVEESSIREDDGVRLTR